MKQTTLASFFKKPSTKAPEEPAKQKGPGAEVVGRNSVGASEGFLGWVAYMGAAVAGYPLSLIVKRFGWSIFFRTLVGACFAGFLLLAPISNALSYQQREAAAVAETAAPAAE